MAYQKPTSFSFYLLKGETLVYPRGTHTPNCPYQYVATPLELDAKVLKGWFLEAIEPLVGKKAAQELETLFGKDERGEIFGDFIDEAIKFRKHVK